MAKNVILYIGLPGAGKTVLAEKTRREFPQQSFVLDDPSFLQKHSPTMLTLAIERAQDHSVVHIADPALCFAEPVKVFAQVKEWLGEDVEIAVVLFSDDLEACKANVAYRHEIQGIKRKISDADIEWFASGYRYVNWVYACYNRAIPCITTPAYQGHVY